MLPNTWVAFDGSTIARPAGMSDSEWSDVLYGAGWTPGATPSATGSGGAGSPGAATPTQVVGLIAQVFAAGGTLFSTVYGAINAVDPATGTATTATGQTVPIAGLGTVTSTGGGTTDINVDVKEEGFFDKPANIALVMGGALLLLLVVMQR